MWDVMLLLLWLWCCNCSISIVITIMFLSQTMFSNMAVELDMPPLNLAMHPRAGHDQHNHHPLRHFRFSLLVTATTADAPETIHHGIPKTAVVWR